jgi:DNA-binding transcriptional ArsR family regulator
VVFDALGDPTRRQILELLASGEQPAGAVVEALPISQPAVSQHLKVLRAAQLVTMRADGNRRLYAVDPAGVDAAQAWLARLTDSFSQPLDALETEIARGKRARAGQAATARDRQRRSA